MDEERIKAKLDDLLKDCDMEELLAIMQELKILLKENRNGKSDGYGMGTCRRIC